MCRDALNIQVCGCVREALVPHVNKQVVGSEKITSKDGLLDVCNDKDPPKCPRSGVSNRWPKVGIEVPLTDGLQT